MVLHTSSLLNFFFRQETWKTECILALTGRPKQQAIGQYIPTPCKAQGIEGIASWKTELLWTSAYKAEGEGKPHQQLQILTHYDAYQLVSSFEFAGLQGYLLKVLSPYPYEAIPGPLDQP